MPVSPTRQSLAKYKNAVYVLSMLCGLLAVTVVILSVMLINNHKNVAEKPDTAKNSSSALTSSVNPEKEKILNLAKDLNNWNLLLVNSNNPLPDNFVIETESIKPCYARDVGMSFDSRAVSNLNEMCAAAENDGISLLVISCYRPHSKQVSLFNNELAEVKAENPNLSEEDAIKKASTVVAYPGTSEHEVGLAIDFNSVEETFEHSAQFEWLKNNAEKYGFVMRYPKEKEDITGVIYEPWHYRFVGKEHAAKMNELNMCLEEYVEYLKAQTK